VRRIVSHCQCKTKRLSRQSSQEGGCGRQGVTAVSQQGLGMRHPGTTEAEAFSMAKLHQMELCSEGGGWERGKPTIPRRVSTPPLFSCNAHR
jgi:hypothetical protein